MLFRTHVERTRGNERMDSIRSHICPPVGMTIVPNRFDARLNFGVMYQGSPSASITAAGAAADPALAKDVAAAQSPLTPKARPAGRSASHR